jgi:hypothetical protein
MAFDEGSTEDQARSSSQLAIMQFSANYNTINEESASQLQKYLSNLSVHHCEVSLGAFYSSHINRLIVGDRLCHQKHLI